MPGSPTAVHPLFDLGPSPMRFGDVPWPDDAYVDGSGKVSVRACLRRRREFADALASSMADLDGFGIRPDHLLSLRRRDRSAFVAGLPGGLARDRRQRVLHRRGTSSPDAFERIPIDVRYERERREVRLRPANHAASPGRLYAAVVTRAVRDTDGRASRARAFVALRDAAAAPSMRSSSAARARYAPLLDTLLAPGRARASRSRRWRCSACRRALPT